MIVELVLDKLKDTSGKIVQMLTLHAKEAKDLIENMTIVHSVLEEVVKKQYYDGAEPSNSNYTQFVRAVESVKATMEDLQRTLEEMTRKKELEKNLKNAKSKKPLEDKTQAALAMCNTLHEKHEILGSDPKRGSKESIGSSLPATPKGSNDSFQNLNAPPRQYQSTAMNNPSSPKVAPSNPLTKSQSFGVPRGKETADWLFLSINRAQAEKSLSECNEGAFLVRSSSVPNCYALSRFKPGQQPEHFIIAQNATGGYYVQDCSDANHYPSLNDLIASTTELDGFRPLGDVQRRMTGAPSPSLSPVQQHTPPVNNFSPPPPPPDTSAEWREATAPDGRIYYYNVNTKQTSWKKPY